MRYIFLVFLYLIGTDINGASGGGEDDEDPRKSRKMDSGRSVSGGDGWTPFCVSVGRIIRGKGPGEASSLSASESISGPGGAASSPGGSDDKSLYET